MLGKERAHHARAVCANRHGAHGCLAAVGDACGRARCSERGALPACCGAGAGRAAVAQAQGCCGTGAGPEARHCGRAHAAAWRQLGCDAHPPLRAQEAEAALGGEQGALQAKVDERARRQRAAAERVEAGGAGARQEGDRVPAVPENLLLQGCAKEPHALALGGVEPKGVQGAAAASRALPLPHRWQHRRGGGGHAAAQEVDRRFCGGAGAAGGAAFGATARGNAPDARAREPGGGCGGRRRRAAARVGAAPPVHGQEEARGRRVLRAGPCRHGHPQEGRLLRGRREVAWRDLLLRAQVGQAGGESKARQGARKGVRADAGPRRLAAGRAAAGQVPRGGEGGV